MLDDTDNNMEEDYFSNFTEVGKQAASTQMAKGSIPMIY